MAVLLGDAVFTFSNDPRRNSKAVDVLPVVSALGCFFSPSKSQCLPAKTGRFLALTMNVSETRFEVPADIMSYVCGSLEEFFDLDVSQRGRPKNCKSERPSGKRG